MNNLVKQVPQNLARQYVETDAGWVTPDAVQPYDPYSANQPYGQPPQYILIDPNQLPPRTALTPMETLGRSMQNMFQMQMRMLNDLDARMNRLEQPRVQQQRQPQGNPGEFYTQTWWALWGILMLILGSALVVVLMLILRS